MAEEEYFDPVPSFLAAIDQAVATAPQFARYAWALFGAFKEEGFTESQAIYLTANQLKTTDS